MILGAGVAGLQAIATAKRLGALVSAYDVRAAVKEQIESLGAKFVVLDMGEGAEGTGGYAPATDEAYYQTQRELLGNDLREQNAELTPAAAPGRNAPVLVPKEMVEKMLPGSVIVDIAAERGGNCELDSRRRNRRPQRRDHSGPGQHGIARSAGSRWKPDVRHQPHQLSQADGDERGCHQHQSR